MVVGRSSREHANSFEINDPLVSRKHVRIDTKAWPVPEQGVRGEDVIAVATALGANPIGVRHHADDSVEKADRRLVVQDHPRLREMTREWPRR